MDELAAFVAAHPKGYFLAEWFRFWHFDFMKPDVDWVEAHMTRIDEASSGDVRVYAWGMDPRLGWTAPAVMYNGNLGAR